MLATVQPSSAPSTNSATQNISLVYNSTTNTLTFSDGTHDNLTFLLVDEETTITVTLENAEFAENPITWISHPTPEPNPTPENNQLSFTVPSPASYFKPWSLSFGVNVNGANGLTSPILFLVLPPDSADSTTIGLTYNPGTGSFTLDSATNALANLSLLVNTITPFTTTINLSVDSSGTFNPAVVFNSTPIVVDGVKPSWLSFNRSSPTQMTLSIASDPGKFAGFRFALDVQSPGNTVTVLSPDPILINATIGDGSQ